MEIRPALSILVEEKIGTIQPHDDALVVILKIGGICEDGDGGPR